MNKHCDFVSIDVAYDLIDKLKLKDKEFASLCGITPQQFCNWQNKGRMPQYRHSHLINELKKLYKKEYDDKLKLLEDD